MLQNTPESIQEARNILKLPDSFSDKQVDNIVIQTNKLAKVFVEAIIDKRKRTKKLRIKSKLTAKGYKRSFVNDFFKYLEKVRRSEMNKEDLKLYDQIFEDYLEISKTIDVSDVKLTEEDKEKFDEYWED